jgi:hypothetical protein
MPTLLSTAKYSTGTGKLFVEGLQSHAKEAKKLNGFMTGQKRPQRSFSGQLEYMGPGSASCFQPVQISFGCLEEAARSLQVFASLRPAPRHWRARLLA